MSNIPVGVVANILDFVGMTPEVCRYIGVKDPLPMEKHKALTKKQFSKLVTTLVRHQDRMNTYSLTRAPPVFCSLDRCVKPGTVMDMGNGMGHWFLAGQLRTSPRIVGVDLRLPPYQKNRKKRRSPGMMMI